MFSLGQEWGGRGAGVCLKMDVLSAGGHEDGRSSPSIGEIPPLCDGPGRDLPCKGMASSCWAGL